MYLHFIWVILGIQGLLKISLIILLRINYLKILFLIHLKLHSLIKALINI